MRWNLETHFARCGSSFLIGKSMMGKNMGKELAKNILDTIAYYDVMDYPMTSFEIWKYLNKKDEAGQAGCTLKEIKNELEDSELLRIIESYQGYFFLRGKRNLVEARLERNKLANEKFRILKGVAWWLRFVPFVRMVAVTGSMAMKNTEHASDLDLLVVLKHGRIFTGRTLVTAMVHLLGKRRYADKIKDRICLNYFITTQSLGVVLKDLFSASEYSLIIPIFGFRFFKKFQENNSWIKNYKPNFIGDSMANLRTLRDSFLARTVRRIGERVFGMEFLEESLKKWQIKRIKADPRTHQDGSMIVADSEMLIFLPDPQGPKVFEKFKEQSEKFLQIV